MATICPTVTAREPHEYREQMERIAPFATRIHIDLADGVFAPNQLIDLAHVWWPVGVTADIHLMYEAVVPFLKQLEDLKPNMVIVHAEGAGNFYQISRELVKRKIKTGVALLPETPVSTIKPAIADIDHVLIFSGDLGYFGGTAKLQLLEKVQQIRKLRSDIEIGWDGGINVNNAGALVSGGIDVLNVGGGIQRAKNPANAYAKLNKVIQGE